MKFMRSGILVLLLAFAAPLMRAWQAGAPVQSGTESPVTGVRILEPSSGQKIDHDFVTVHFEAANANQTTSSIPTFVLQLDGRAPITSSDNQVTFTGLQPGTHTISVQAVDANGTPILGSRNVVQFIVTPAATPGAKPQSQSEPSEARGLKLMNIAMQADEKDGSGNAASPGADQSSRAAGSDEGLPDTGSALPLLSIIGFGVLMGGIFSARRTR